MEIPVYNYTIEKEGDSSKVIYNKSLLSYKAAGPFCFYAAFFAIFLTAAVSPQSVSAGVTIWVMLVLLMGFGTVFLINHFKKSKKGEFTITKEAILVNAKSYPLDHVTAFSIKDPDGGYVSSSTYIVSYHNTTSLAGSVNSLANGMQNVSREVGNALRKQIKATQYKIVIRFATKDIVIASGLGENECESLFDKVTEIAGYTKTT